MENIIAEPLYLWAFQTNREQLKVYFPYRSKKHPIIPTELYNTIVGKKQRIDILMKSHLSVILVKKLVGNVRLYPRFPRFHAQRILTRQHYFQDIKCVETLAGHSNKVYSVAFHPTALLLATGSYDKTAKLWRFSDDGSAATCVATLAGHSGYVYSVAFHPTAPLLATGSYDKTVRLWR
ncbi:MAG: WD40 repeat domain-containing protein [Candidatus Methylopumilus sp.]